MTNQAIIHIDQITTAWLTSALSKSGALTCGSVTSFKLDAGRGTWSSNGSLTINYTDDAQGELPSRLFLKMANTDLDNGESFDDSEVNYYTRDYVDVENAPLLRCYDAAYSAELKRYHILMDDVSATHIEARAKEPTLEYGLALAEGLAIIHARWWGKKKLTESGATIHNAAHIQSFVDIAEPGMGHIVSRFSSELSQPWVSLMRELFSKHPQVMIQRNKNLNGFTLIHGDTGSANILVPRVGDRPIYIIDRQPFNWSFTTWLGVYDIAYAIVLDWKIETRRQCEIPMLKHYHEHLIKNGVTNYAWGQLYDDYRLCVAMCVYIAVEYCRGGINERWIQGWLQMLKNSLTACDDLQCSELWG